MIIFCRWSTIFQDLNGNIDVVLPAAPIDLREAARAELVQHGELIFWQNPTIQQVVDILSVWLYLMQETQVRYFM